MRSYQAGLLLLLPIIFFICVLPVQAVPPLPAEFYGNVLIDGTPAPAGTTITAFLQDVPKGAITTDIDGFYGGPGLYDARLKVIVSEDEYQASNLVISFQINGISAVQSIIFEPGSAQQFDLFTGSGSSGGAYSPGLTPVPVQTAPTETNPEPGESYTEPSQSSQSDNGPSIRYGLERDEKFKSDDGMATVTFKKDTLLFAPSGQFLQSVRVTPRAIDDLPPAASNQSLMFSGYAYEISPERTYFNPEGVFSITIPIERVSDLLALNPQIYEYAPQTASWAHIRTSSNHFTGEISGTIYEAAIYALFLENQASFATPNVTNSSQTQPPLPPVAGQPPVPADIQYPQYPLEQPLEPATAPPTFPPVDSLAMQAQLMAPENTPEQIFPDQTPVQQIETMAPKFPVGTPEITQAQATPGPSPFSIIDTIMVFIKKALSGQVGIVIGLSLLIILINAIAYLVYTRWWLVRNP